jgi:integrase/recombinase XerD
MSLDLSSSFAPYIKGMRNIKHNSGFVLGCIDGHLAEFDLFCRQLFPEKDWLDRELLYAWVYNTKSKSVQEINKRLRTMRHLGNYMLSIGMSAYVSTSSIKKPKSPEPHIFTDGQLSEFFRSCDDFKQLSYPPYRHIVVPTMFRTIYCCGLRNSEACNLKCSDINLRDGITRILGSKGHKDRLVYMSEDLLGLCQKYDTCMQVLLPCREYFFPSSRSKHYSKTSLCRLFDCILNKTSFHDRTGKKPTCHGLRHTFAVNSMRQCIASGNNFDNMIQYLSRYMGHRSPQNTMYYLHMTVNLVPEIRKKAKGFEDILNGVAYVED